MSELLPSHPPERYESARDQALHRMTEIGWSNRTDGRLEAPTGIFSVVCNSPAELREVMGALEGEDLPAFNDFDLLGNWMVVENQEGYVRTALYSDQVELVRVFKLMQQQFAEWEAQR